MPKGDEIIHKQHQESLSLSLSLSHRQLKIFIRHAHGQVLQVYIPKNLHS